MDDLTGSFNIIELCTFFENRDTGLQMGGGASQNQVINCDSYANADASQGNADGFAPKLDVGTGNAFFGCRAWRNSDDGWDGYLRGANDVTTRLESCWCFLNGYLKDGSPSVGNGNGYKTGGSDTKDLMHNVVLTRCLAFDNRVKGFDQNNNRGSITIYHGTAYRNGTNYGLGDTLAFSKGKVLTVANSVALGPWRCIAPRSDDKQLDASACRADAADFLSLDTAGVGGPRNPDGSLPELRFLFPSNSSQLVNAGTDVGLPFNGPAPDLGALETPAVTRVAVSRQDTHGDLVLMQNSPNPFNAATRLAFTPDFGSSILLIYDALGRLSVRLCTNASGRDTCTAGRRDARRFRLLGVRSTRSRVRCRIRIVLLK
jgi:hypothetical protein